MHTKTDLHLAELAVARASRAVSRWKEREAAAAAMTAKAEADLQAATKRMEDLANEHAD